MWFYKTWFYYILFIKTPTTPTPSVSFLLSPIHPYLGILTFSYCFKCVSQKTIISQELLIRICLREFISDLISLALGYILLIFRCIFLLFLLLLVLFFYFFLFDFYYSFNCLSDKFPCCLVIYNLSLFSVVNCFVWYFVVCYLLFVFYGFPECIDIIYMFEFTVYSKLAIICLEVFT